MASPDSDTDTNIKTKSKNALNNPAEKAPKERRKSFLHENRKKSETDKETEAELRKKKSSAENYTTINIPPNSQHFAAIANIPDIELRKKKTSAENREPTRRPSTINIPPKQRVTIIDDSARCKTCAPVTTREVLVSFQEVHRDSGSKISSRWTTELGNITEPPKDDKNRSSNSDVSVQGERTERTSSESLFLQRATLSTDNVGLMARTSLSSYKGRTSSASMNIDSIDESRHNSLNDRNWSWKYLRDQFKNRDLENLCHRYMQRLKHGYFFVFLLLNFAIALTHIIVLISLKSVKSIKNSDILYDIIAYSIMGIVPLLALVFKEKLTKKHPFLPLIISSIVVFILILSDITVPIIHEAKHGIQHASPSLRPAYLTHTLLGCYMFLPLINNSQVFLLAFSTSICHLLSLWMVTYRYSSIFFHRFFSDIFYLLAINGLGVYFRFMNEIIIRRMFLDSRACVEATYKYKYVQQQEEQLTLSILPIHLEKRVTEYIKEILEDKGQQPPQPKESYIQMHDKVTILFADIVNYTKMTASLPVKTLVSLLNDLFGKFDDLSEKHNVLRIKFLGDCYNCVSGLPNSTNSHAKNCVDLGFGMIGIIKNVREKLNLDIDMRIGIHSGRILSGFVGICKWHYDIWSKDVVIANIMEQTGKQGRVHITDKTKELLPKDYFFERSDKEATNDFLLKNNITTYFVSSTINNAMVEEIQNDFQPKFNRKLNVPNRFSAKSRPSLKQAPQWKNQDQSSTLSMPRRRVFMGKVIENFNKMISQADEEMGKEIEKLPLGKFEQWFRSKYINPLLLTFYVNGWEGAFLKQPDPLYKMYVVAATGVLVFIFTSQSLTLPADHWIAWLSLSITLIVFLLLIPVTWTYKIYNNYNQKSLDDISIKSEIEEQLPGHPVVRLFYKLSNGITLYFSARLILFFIICGLLFTCSIIDVVQCNVKPIDETMFLQRLPAHYEKFINCVSPWTLTQTCSLAIIMTFLFLRMSFYVKLFFGCLITLIYTLIVSIYKQNIFQYSESWNIGLEPYVVHIMSVVFTLFVMHLLDRQTEYMNRLDYQWKQNLKSEHEKVLKTHFSNNLLLQNILPIHVAEFYLNPQRNEREQFHEEYDCVAVMFASLTGYTLGVDDDTLDKEFTTLELFNKIICVFDQILLDKNESQTKIEKIKMANWTYMAACGLNPGRRDSITKHHSAAKYVLNLTEFATELMCALNSVNSNFKLRIGISHGNVYAGVVGAKKPLYDIWGNTVNMASRMDSTGIPGCIQVTEETATVLKEEHVKCDYRGLTFVKGKNYVSTYFVALNDNSHLVYEREVPAIDTKL